MAFIFTALWWIAVVAILFVLLLLLALATFIACARQQVMKFQMELPYLKWLTLNQIVEMGFSKIWAMILLPLFYEKGMLEVRLGSDEIPNSVDQIFIDRRGFTSTTIKFYKFRLTKRGGRKKPELKFKDLVPAWNPLPA